MDSAPDHAVRDARWGTGVAVPRRGAPDGPGQPLTGPRRTGRPTRDGLGMDAVAIGGYLVLAVGFGYLSLEPPHDSPFWVMALLLGGGIGSLLVRRRWPRIAFAAALALMLVSFVAGTAAEAILVVISLLTAGIVHSARAAWLWLAATVLAAAAGAAILSHRIRFGPALWGTILPSPTRDPVEGWVNVFVLSGATAVIVTLLGLNIGHRRRHLAALVERSEQMKRERDQQASIASARARERISREMHDVIAHSLAVMIAMADGAEAMAVRRPQESREAIGRVAETGRRTLDEVRRLLRTVREEDGSLLPGQDPQPGIAQVPALIEQFRASGLQVRLELSGSVRDDAVLGLTVFRIVQESLTNVLRHARGVRDVLVRLDLADEEVTILVEDTSDPATPSTDPGRGLVGVRERVAIYDGSVQTGPRGGGGWRVFVRLPLEER